LSYLHYFLLPWYYTDNLSKGSGEEANYSPCHSSIHSTQPALQQRSQSNAAAQKGRPDPQVTGEKPVKVRTTQYKEDFGHREVSAAQDAAILASGWRQSRCWPPRKMRRAKETRSGGAVKEEIFVLMQLYYLPKLATLIFGSISLHTQHWHAQRHFEPSLGLPCMIPR